MNGAARGGGAPLAYTGAGQYDRDRIGQWNQSVVSAQEQGLRGGSGQGLGAGRGYDASRRLPAGTAPPAMIPPAGGAAAPRYRGGVTTPHHHHHRGSSMPRAPPPPQQQQQPYYPARPSVGGASAYSASPFHQQHRPSYNPSLPGGAPSPYRGYIPGVRTPLYPPEGAFDQWGRAITRDTFRPARGLRPNLGAVHAGANSSYNQMIQAIRDDRDEGFSGIRMTGGPQGRRGNGGGPENDHGGGAGGGNVDELLNTTTGGQSADAAHADDRAVRFQVESERQKEDEDQPQEEVARLRVRSRDHTLDDALLKMNKAILVFSFMGLGTMTISSIVTWYTNPIRESGLDGIPAPIYLDLDPSDTGGKVCEFLAYATTFTTLLTMAYITLYYRLLLKQKQKEWSVRLVPWQQVPQQEEEVKRSYSFWQSDLCFWWYTEMFVHFVHPMPFMDGTSTFVTIRQKTVYSYLQLWMLLRFYLVLRYWHTVNPAYVNRSDILFDNNELQRMNFHMTWPFTMKFYLYSHTWTAMGILTGILFFIFGFALFIIERVEQPTVYGKLDIVLFYCFTTATTIGYGRVTPLSKMGRILTFLLGCYGQILLTFFTAIITNLLEPSKEEELIQNYVRATSAEHYFRVASAMLIQAAWKSSKLYKVLKGQVHPNERQRLEKMWAVMREKHRLNGEDPHHVTSGRGVSKADQILAGDDVSLPDSSHSPRSRSRSLNDGSSSVGTSEQKERLKSRRATEDLDILHRASKFGQEKSTMEWNKRNIHTILTIDANTYGRVANDGHSFHHVKQKKRENFVKSPYERDMEVVMRLNARAKAHQDEASALGGSSGPGRGKNGSGTLKHLLMMGTTRQDMPSHDLPTFRKRQEKLGWWGWLPLYAPNHKSNFLFEALKRFKRAKRHLANCQLEAKDGVLERELGEISNISVSLDDHVTEHLADIDLLGDRVLVQLKAVKSAIQKNVR